MTFNSKSILYGTGVNCFLVTVLLSLFLLIVIGLNFLVLSYEIPVISKDKRGTVIATFWLRSACCSSLAKNFCRGPYARGTFILLYIEPSLFSFLHSILLNRVPNPMTHFLIILLYVYAPNIISYLIIQMGCLH